MKLMIINNLEKYIDEFFGYGNINSNIWFIGYEEGSRSNSVKELKQRVNVWMKLDKEVLCDCKDFHLNLKMGNEEPFTVGKNQPTWSRYIDILTLYSKNYKLNKTEKRDYLRKKFAKLNSNHALLELFPIPCTSIPSWSYKDLEEQIDYFSTKENYQKQISEKRLSKIIELIHKFKPKFIIFNGTTALSSWEAIISNKFETVRIGKSYYLYLFQSKINFFVVPKLIYNTNAVIYSIASKMREFNEKN